MRSAAAAERHVLSQRWDGADRATTAGGSVTHMRWPPPPPPPPLCVRAVREDAALAATAAAGAHVTSQYRAGRPSHTEARLGLAGALRGRLPGGRGMRRAPGTSWWVSRQPSAQGQRSEARVIYPRHPCTDSPQGLTPARWGGGGEGDPGRSALCRRADPVTVFAELVRIVFLSRRRSPYCHRGHVFLIWRRRWPRVTLPGF